MAARLNPKHDEKTRAKIRTSQLINRLQTFALLEVDSADFSKKAMTRDQIAAAKTLLSKTLPDLANIAHEGGDRPIEHVHKITRKIVKGS